MSAFRAAPFLLSRANAILLTASLLIVFAGRAVALTVARWPLRAVPCTQSAVGLATVRGALGSERVVRCMLYGRTELADANGIGSTGIDSGVH